MGECAGRDAAEELVGGRGAGQAREVGGEDAVAECEVGEGVRGLGQWRGVVDDEVSGGALEGGEFGEFPQAAVAALGCAFSDEPAAAWVGDQCEVDGEGAGRAAWGSAR